MDETSPLHQNPQFWRRLVFWGLLLLFIITFWKEVVLTLSGLWIYLQAGKSCVETFLSPIDCMGLLAAIKLDVNMLRAIFIVTINISAYLVISVLSIYQAAQFALPVRTADERFKAFDRMLRYLIGQHGPAIFIKEGVANTRADEAENIHAGVALVDLSSAIVLEQQENTWAWQLRRHTGKQTREEDETEATTQGPLTNFKKAFQFLNEEDLPWVRVAGPGVVFTDSGEKIHSVVDLRKQIRTQVETRAVTRDGIEIKMPVLVIFSISDAPEVIPVAYLGGRDLGNLYGLKLTEKKETRTIKIDGFFELDPEDRAEIHNFVRFGKLPKEKKPQKPVPAHRIKTPYPFHEERVFAAAYAQALLPTENPKVWHELPINVATDIFRKEIERYNFDDVLKTDEPNVFPLPEIKEKFSRAVRFQGLLSYKLVHKLVDQADSTKIEAILDPGDVGKTFKNTDLKMSSAHELYNSKVLRDRGIKVIAAAFPEVRVDNESVKKNMIANWKARWEREIDITRAQHELEAMRERSRARAQTQSEMTYVLSNLFQTTPHSKEALALRIFQSLEKAAASNLEPKEVLAMLQNLHRWLLIEHKEKPKTQPSGSSGREQREQHEQPHSPKG